MRVLTDMLRWYSESRWLPTALMFLALATAVGMIVAGKGGAYLFMVPLLILSAALLLGMLLVVIWSMSRKRWIVGICNLLGLMATGGAYLLVCGTVVVIMLAPEVNNSEMVKDIVIPDGMEVIAPIDPRRNVVDPDSDADGRALVATFTSDPTTMAKTTNLVNVDFPALDEFKGPNRALLLRHLASSSEWFLSRQRGKLFAYRRFVVDGKWRTTMNGFYSGTDFDSQGNNRFQVRVLIGPDGDVMSQPFSKIATIASNSDGDIQLRVEVDKEFNQGAESYLVVRSKAGTLEVFEQFRSRHPFTPLVLQQLNVEFQAVLASATGAQQGFDPALLPPESMRTGPADIVLESGGQGGIYDVFAYANPGEAGYVYLKVFEATRNTQLSVARITERSTEYIGWSDDPQQQFFYNAAITIYEGDWGNYYPARFELWFVPDSGNPERKLVEKIFKVEGWER